MCAYPRLKTFKVSLDWHLDRVFLFILFDCLILYIIFFADEPSASIEEPEASPPESEPISTTEPPATSAEPLPPSEGKQIIVKPDNHFV